jgi:hypothetical protein
MFEEIQKSDAATEAPEIGALHRIPCGDTMGAPPVQSRKRGKCMSRRTGQNPKVRTKKRSNGQKVFYFQ